MAWATDEAIVEIRGLGFSVDVQATPEQQAQLLAQALQAGGPGATDVGIA
jgi:hypothetical protein